MQQTATKYKIIYLKYGREEPHTHWECCYETLETCSHLVLTVCASS